jgi:hypothetical protein
MNDPAWAVRREASCLHLCRPPINAAAHCPPLTIHPTSPTSPPRTIHAANAMNGSAVHGYAAQPVDAAGSARRACGTGAAAQRQHRLPRCKISRKIWLNLLTR